MPGIYVSVLINPGILSGLCGQFNQQLDDGEYAQAGIDINMRSEERRVGKECTG